MARALRFKFMNILYTSMNINASFFVNLYCNFYKNLHLYEFVFSNLPALVHS